MTPRNGASPNDHDAACDVFVDFDGMIVPADATDGLLARFAHPSWRDIEKDWQQGRLASIECMARQIALLRASPGEIARFLEGVRVDPAFPAFVGLCRRNRANLAILSDGLDLVVRAVLRRAGLDVPFFANELCWQGGDRWSLRFPFARRDCPQRMGNCKCGHRRRPGAIPSVMVGDGRSDFCIAGRCDLVLAKGRLAEHCRALGLPHAEVADFGDARRVLSAWFRTRAARGPAAERADEGAGARARS